MNILWHSVPAFHNSGYGVQTREFVWRLMDAGHNVMVVSASLHDLPDMTWMGIRHLPGGESKHGVDGVFEWARRQRPDIVITLFDIWDFPPMFGEDLKKLGVEWMPVVPVDHDPIHDRMIQILKTASMPTAMSKFGLEQMKFSGIKGRYFPLGVDTKIFKPTEVDKKKLGYEKKFVVGCVANNLETHDRKGLALTIEAFGKFHKKHPNSVFYFHGDPHQQPHRGVNMVGLAKKFGFQIHHTEWWLNYAGLTAHEMADLYSMFDVFMLLTGGEGFGVPLIESQACDTPVIVTDFTAPRDLVGHGWKIPIKDKRWTLMSSYWGNADVDKAVEALEKAHALWLKGDLAGGRDFALQFDFDTIFKKYLTPILKEVSDANATPRKKVRDPAAV